MNNFKKYDIDDNSVQAAYEDALARLEELGNVPLPDEMPREIIYFSSFRTLGLHVYRRGQHIIKVNEAFLSGYMSPTNLMETIVHEIIHTFPGCNNHGPRFKAWANKLNRVFRTEIWTHCSAQSSKEFRMANVSNTKNIQVCVECGNVSLYPKTTDKIRRWRTQGIEYYFCGKCKNNLSKEERNLMLIQFEGKACDGILPLYSNKKDKADIWKMAHVPPNEFIEENYPLGFVWSAEALWNEFWWISDEEERQQAIYNLHHPKILSIHTKKVQKNIKPKPNKGLELSPETEEEIAAAAAEKVVNCTKKAKKRIAPLKQRHLPHGYEQITLF